MSRSAMLGLIGLKGSKCGPDTTSSASCKKHERPQEEAEEISSLKERVSPDNLG